MDRSQERDTLIFSVRRNSGCGTNANASIPMCV